MISPYQVPGPQGGVMSFLQDWLNANQQRDMRQQAMQNEMADRAVLDATRGYLNQQAGYAPGVDPMSVLKFLSGQENLQGAQQNREFARQGQEWKQQDREQAQNSAQGIWNAFQPGGAVAGMYDSPALSAALAGGPNPQLVDYILGQVGGIDQYGREMMGNSVQHQQTMDRMGQQSQFNLGEIQARGAAEMDLFNQKATASQQAAALERQQQISDQAKVNSTIAQLAGVNPNQFENLGMIPMNAFGALVDMSKENQAQQQAQIAQMFQAILADEKLPDDVRQRVHSQQIEQTGDTIPPEVRTRLQEILGANEQDVMSAMQQQQQPWRDADGSLAWQPILQYIGKMIANPVNTPVPGLTR